MPRRFQNLPDFCREDHALDCVHDDRGRNGPYQTVILGPEPETEDKRNSQSYTSLEKKGHVLGIRAKDRVVGTADEGKRNYREVDGEYGPAIEVLGGEENGDELVPGYEEEAVERKVQGCELSQHVSDEGHDFLMLRFVSQMVDTGDQYPADGLTENGQERKLDASNRVNSVGV